MEGKNTNFLLGNSNIYYLGGEYYTEKEDEVVPIYSLIDMDKERLASINKELDIPIKDFVFNGVKNGFHKYDLLKIEQTALTQLISLKEELKDAYPTIRNNIYVALNNAKISNKLFVFNNNVYSCNDFLINIKKDVYGHFVVEVKTTKEAIKQEERHL